MSDRWSYTHTSDTNGTHMSGTHSFLQVHALGPLSRRISLEPSTSFLSVALVIPMSPPTSTSHPPTRTASSSEYLLKISPPKRVRAGTRTRQARTRPRLRLPPPPLPRRPSHPGQAAKAGRRSTRAASASTTMVAGTAASTQPAPTRAVPASSAATDRTVAASPAEAEAAAVEEVEAVRIVGL